MSTVGTWICCWLATRYEKKYVDSFWSLKVSKNYGQRRMWNMCSILNLGNAQTFFFALLKCLNRTIDCDPFICNRHCMFIAEKRMFTPFCIIDPVLLCISIESKREKKKITKRTVCLCETFEPDSYRQRSQLWTFRWSPRQRPSPKQCWKSFILIRRMTCGNKTSFTTCTFVKKIP